MLRRFLITTICVWLQSVLMAQTAIDTTHIDEVPVIELTYDAAAFNTETFTPAHFVFHSADTLKEFSCTVRHRGGTSLAYDKPNYALKFVDEEGEPKDVKFMGMRKDNNWILDGMASDFAKMRNRVSMDLWLDFSHKPYHQEEEPKAVNGYRGHFVEVYANGDYMGLFCLMERLDRKQLKLKKFAPNEEDSTCYHHRGLMYKAMSGYDTRTPYFLKQGIEPDNTQSYYDGMQCEYPDVRVGEPWDWSCLRDNIDFLVGRTYTIFTKHIGEHFDLPVFNDYILFVDLLYATDNIGKNYFCWFYDQSSEDQRLGITPWDLDATWGRDYQGSRAAASNQMTNKSNFFTCCSENFFGYADTLQNRYVGLRDNLWAEDSLLARFDNYFDLFQRSGAWERDSARWYGSNVKIWPIENERSYIHDWIHDRLCTLDSAYHYNPASGIREIPSEQPNGSTVCLDLMGRKVKEIQNRGLYILDRKKILIKQ